MTDSDDKVTWIEPFVKNLAEKSRLSIPINPGDYQREDGIWMCGKCHTPKEQVTEILGNSLRHMIRCQCESERKAAEQKRQRHEHYRDRLLERCFRYDEMRDWTFANDNGNNPELTKICRNFVDNFAEFAASGRGLLLYGNSGLGKTWFAASIANALIDHEIACKFEDFTQIANELSDMREGRNDYIRMLSEYPLLIIDDLDAERDTAYMDEIVFSVIDARSKARKPLIVTTNLTREKLRNPKSTSKARIISRLYQVCIPYEVVGTDQRYADLASDYGHFKKILGI